MYIDGPVTHGILRKSANAQKVRELKLAIDNGMCILYIVHVCNKTVYMKNVNIYTYDVVWIIAYMYMCAYNIVMFSFVGQQIDLDTVATHVVGALFKEFLRSIPGGLLPSSRYTVLVASNDCKDIDDRALLITKCVLCVLSVCVCACCICLISH